MREHVFSGVAEFVASVQNGSFAGAAVVLRVTGSAVGKSVSRLEARLGLKLLHRTTRHLTLTAEGEAYYQTCQRALRDLREFEDALESGRQVPAGSVRVELPGAFGRMHVLPALLDLAQVYPRIDLSVNFSERTVDLVEDGVDIAVRIGVLDDDSSVIARRLGAQRVRICASPAYIERHGLPETPGDLLKHSCIGGWQKRQRPTWILRDHQGAYFDQDISVRHRFSDGEAMLRAALAGSGLAQFPTWLIGAHFQTGALVPVLEEFAGGEMPIHAIWPASKYIQPKVRVIIDELVRLSAQPGSAFQA